MLIPGLALNRQVSYFKVYKAKQLQQQKSKLYSSFKQFDIKEDSAIIEEKKELSDKLNRVQDELAKLKKMRTSHIDRVE